jgi:hypothetical protein
MARQGPDGSTVKRNGAGELRQADHFSRWAIPTLTDQAEALCWNDAPVGELVDLIDAITRTGAAVSFSKLRNANGVSLTILDGQEREKHYARTEDELHILIRRLRSVAEPIR